MFTVGIFCFPVTFNSIPFPFVYPNYLCLYLSIDGECWFFELQLPEYHSQH